jgi:UDP-3-O-[3-hydroxymyristoyl] glucosamine N-acyltransferase
MRFLQPIPLAQIAKIAGAEAVGDAATKVAGIASLECARNDEMSFVRSVQWRAAAEKSLARVLLVSPEYGAIDRPGLVAASTDMALARLGAFATSQIVPTAVRGVDAAARVSPEARLGANVSVGPGAVIEAGATIGDGATIGAASYVGHHSSIGAKTVLHPGVKILWGCTIGALCVIHPGAVIGSDGFGFIQLPDGTNHKLPQLGGVTIGDDVEIGANCTIDRAMLDQTIIESGVKLDNLVHIAHNAVIGANAVLTAQVGVAGSTKIGKRTLVGGQAGISSHLTIGDDCRVGGGSTVFESCGDGVELWGFPAKEKTRALRESAAAFRSEETRSELRRLRKIVETLEARMDKSE